MRLPELVRPIRMRRIAVVAPAAALRDVLVRVADAGSVQFDGIGSVEPGGDTAASRLRALVSTTGTAPAVLSPTAVNLDELVRAGRADLLAGEAELERHAGAAVRDDGGGGVAALAGWCPSSSAALLAARLREVGGSVVRLPAPRGIDPPTLLRDDNTVRRSFTPLVRTYGTVPYRDLDPTVPSALAYVLMFGMMFGDAGHGLLVLILAALLWSGRVRWLARWRSIWPFVAGAGATSTIFGVLYGEFFGPTGVIPVLWLSPLDQPVPLLAAGIGVGAVLLAVAYGIGVYNRWREGGLAMALYSSSGVAGTALFLGFGAVAAGIYLHGPVWMIAGVLLVVAGLGLATIGLAAESPGGGSGAMTVVIGLLDLIIRLGSNVVSFARLAAFGLTHAALAMLFWRGTVALAPHGPLGVISAAVLFILGTAVACSLEALVAGVQAMRLEYYELFSRVFETEGRPFQPWHVPLARPAGEESTR